MVLGKRLLLYSENDSEAGSIQEAMRGCGWIPTVCSTFHELRGRIEGADYDVLVIEPAAAARRLVQESSPDHLLTLPLAEIEKRHIHRVLASTNHNKTKAARILGIDTKTLYNKLKAYRSAEQVARKRANLSGDTADTSL